MILPSDPNKILVIQTASIGDVILATPLLEKIHHFFPDAQIHLLVKKGMESLFTGHPYVKKILNWDKSTDKYKNLHRLLRTVRQENYDLVLNIQRFAASGFITAFSRGKIKIGFNKNPFSPLFSHRVKHRIRKGEFHEVERNQCLLPIDEIPTNFRISLYPTQRDYARMSPYKTKAYITISPASLWFTKQFPKEKWVDFLRKVDQQLIVYFLGSKNDTRLCEEIIKMSGHKNSLNLSGNLSFLESAALMRDAIMNFMNDSAPLHLASSVNAKTSAIFCSTVKEFGFGPLSDDSVIIETKEKLKCRPCGLHGHQACPEKHFKCALTIDESELLKRLEYEAGY